MQILLIILTITCFTSLDAGPACSKPIAEQPRVELFERIQHLVWSNPCGSPLTVTTQVDGGEIFATFKIHEKREGERREYTTRASWNCVQERVRYYTTWVHTMGPHVSETPSARKKMLMKKIEVHWRSLSEFDREIMREASRRRLAEIGIF